MGKIIARNTSSCSKKCLGFICPLYEKEKCGRIFSIITGNDGEILAIVPTTIQFSDEYMKKNNIIEEENIGEVLMKVKKDLENKGYTFTKQEVIEKLKSEYKININERTLKYYGTERLIEPGVRDNLPGIKGSVSFYKKNTPDLIYFIKILQGKAVAGYTLKRIIEYFSLLRGERPEELKELVKIYNGLQATSKSDDIAGIIRRNRYNFFKYVTVLRSLAELSLLKKFISKNIKIDIGEVVIKDNYVTVSFGEPVKKIIRYRKEGIDIENF